MNSNRFCFHIINVAEITLVLTLLTPHADRHGGIDIVCCLFVVLSAGYW